MLSQMPQVAPKLCRMIPRLASTADAEVVATARAIERTLDSAGLCWHDLAACIDRGLPAPSPAPEEPAMPTWRQMQLYCVERARLLSLKEGNFVRNIGGWRGKPTPKQLQWLADIYDRLGGAL